MLESIMCWIRIVQEISDVQLDTILSCILLYVLYHGSLISFGERAAACCW